jgi:hypothetical protein
MAINMVLPVEVFLQNGCLKYRIALSQMVKGPSYALPQK